MRKSLRGPKQSDDYTRKCRNKLEGEGPIRDIFEDTDTIAQREKESSGDR